MNRQAAGFTLMEVLVALVLAGIAALLAHELFRVALGSARALAEARAATETRFLGERWLRLALGSLEAGDMGGFEGRPERLTFSTWLEGVDPWHEPVRVTLTVNTGRLEAAGGPDPVTLATDVLAVEFDYLLEPGAEAQWVRVWDSPLSAPLAVRVRLRRHTDGRVVADTSLYLIGGRG